MKKQTMEQIRAQKIYSNLKWGDTTEAIDLICGCKDYKGRPILDRYRDYPRTLIGIAYAMGVADGKRRERARRHS